MSRFSSRGSLAAGLIIAGAVGFTVLPAEAAVADIHDFGESQSGEVPFSDMLSRIAEIETEMQAFEDRTAFQDPPQSIREPEQATTAELPALDQFQDGGTGIDLSDAAGLMGLDRPQGTGTRTGGDQAPAVQASGGALVQRVVSTALSKVGEGEASDGTSFYGKWYDGHTKQKGFAAAPWCDMFLAWVAVQNGAQEQMGIYAYTPWHAQWFKKQGRFDTKPRVGDLVFFDWGGSKNISAIDHIGMVTGVNPDGTVSTVEGNVSDKVVTRKRSMNTIVGFGHPAYGN
ncbi:CHAP domain-containing protein [Planobispora longispora]|nr:CHAP domain-containing protein [Planobispora longispora]